MYAYTYKTKCDICGAVNEVPNYGDWDCCQCGQGYNYDEAHQITLTDAQLALLRNPPRWIPVEERLPSEGSGGVLGFRRSDIAAGEHSYGMAWNHGGKLAWNEPMTPTHWMPLPAPPTSLDAVREQWDQLHKGPRPMPEVE